MVAAFMDVGAAMGDGHAPFDAVTTNVTRTIRGLTPELLEIIETVAVYVPEERLAGFARSDSVAGVVAELNEAVSQPPVWPV